MARVTYLARRSVAAGHLSDTEYSIDIDLSATTPGGARKQIVQKQKSLNGTVETQYYGYEQTFDCMVAPFRWHEQPYLREFLDSTEDGSSFTLDLYGSVATPNNPLVVTREDDGYTEERVMPTGDGGDSDYYSVTFKARRNG